MKKLALAIASVLLLTILSASCGTNPDDTKPDGADPSDTNKIHTNDTNTDGSKADDPNVDDADSDDTKSEGTKNDNIPAYEHGTISETGFSSDWLGFDFTLAEGMEISDAAELGQIISDDAKYIDEATGNELVDWSKVEVAYEMMATVTATGSNVVVMTEKVDNDVNVKKYIELIKTGFSNDEEITVTYNDLSSATIAGETYTRFDYVMSIYGMDIEQAMFIRKMGDRMVSICITAENDAEVDSFLLCFTTK